MILYDIPRLQADLKAPVIYLPQVGIAVNLVAKGILIAVGQYADGLFIVDKVIHSYFQVVVFKAVALKYILLKIGGAAIVFLYIPAVYAGNLPGIVALVEITEQVEFFRSPVNITGNTIAAVSRLGKGSIYVTIDPRHFSFFSFYVDDTTIPGGIIFGRWTG